MRSSVKKNRPEREGRLQPFYRPCAGIIQIRFNGSAANSRPLSPVATEHPDKMSSSQANVVKAAQAVNTSTCQHVLRARHLYRALVRW